MKLCKWLFQNKKSVEEINADAKKELEELIKKDKEESAATLHDMNLLKLKLENCETELKTIIRGS